MRDASMPTHPRRTRGHSAAQAVHDAAEHRQTEARQLLRCDKGPREAYGGPASANVASLARLRVDRRGLAGQGEPALASVASVSSAGGAAAATRAAFLPLPPLEAAGPEVFCG